MLDAALLQDTQVLKREVLPTQPEALARPGQGVREDADNEKLGMLDGIWKTHAPMVEHRVTPQPPSKLSAARIIIRAPGGHGEPSGKLAGVQQRR